MTYTVHVAQNDEWVPHVFDSIAAALIFARERMAAGCSVVLCNPPKDVH
jgi:DUF438 domain-containing protein